MGFDMARIRVAILGAGRIAQHMADTFGSATSSLYEPYETGKPYFVAKSAARPASRAATAYGSTKSA